MDSARYGRLSFERLKEEDLVLLHKWLQGPHIREFYQRRTPTWEDTRERYSPRLAPEWPTKCFLARAGHAIGYIQTYRMPIGPNAPHRLAQSLGSVWTSS
jgi:hypothetical protein